MKNNLRTDFPIFNRKEQDYPLCYLDSASTSQKPQAMLDVLMHFYTTYNANVGRAVYQLAEEATACFEGARKAIAQFIRAKNNEIIFTKNASEGINFIAMAWARVILKRVMRF